MIDSDNLNQRSGTKAKSFVNDGVMDITDAIRRIDRIAYLFTRYGSGLSAIEKADTFLICLQKESKDYQAVEDDVRLSNHAAGEIVKNAAGTILSRLEQLQQRCLQIIASGLSSWPRDLTCVIKTVVDESSYPLNESILDEKQQGEVRTEIVPEIKKLATDIPAAGRQLERVANHLKIKWPVENDAEKFAIFQQEIAEVANGEGERSTAEKLKLEEFRVKAIAERRGHEKWKEGFIKDTLQWVDEVQALASKPKTELPQELSAADFRSVLTSKQYALLEYLWDHSPATIHNVDVAIGSKPTKPGTVNRAVSRLDTKLVEVALNIRAEIKNSHVFLVRNNCSLKPAN